MGCDVCLNGTYSNCPVCSEDVSLEEKKRVEEEKADFLYDNKELEDE